jgi:hypothetical protein
MSFNRITIVGNSAKKQMEEENVMPNQFIPENCRYDRMQQQQIDAITNFESKTRPLILKLLGEDFANKPQFQLNGCLSVEELCSQLSAVVCVQ